MAAVRPLLTPDDVAAMVKAGELHREAQFELVDGEIIWLTFPAFYHGQVVLAILFLLKPFADRIGAVLCPDGTGFCVGPGGMNVRRPDVALVTNERRSIVPRDAVWGLEAPDLCVEVLSPEHYGEAYARPKITEYFAAGAKVVWLVNPEDRTVRVYESGRREFTTYAPGDDITLDSIAPGFRTHVAACFPPV